MNIMAHKTKPKIATTVPRSNTAAKEYHRTFAREFASHSLSQSALNPLPSSTKYCFISILYIAGQALRFYGRIHTTRSDGYQRKEYLV